MGKMTLQQMITQLAGGMAVSTQIFVITLLFSLPLGLVIAFGRMSKNKLIQTIVKVYISIMRGTPLMLQLMVVYFWTVLSVSHQSRQQLPSVGYLHRFCH